MPCSSPDPAAWDRRRRAGLAALALLTPLLAAGCGPARQYTPLSAAPLAPGQSRVVTVHADGDWLGTGIPVAPGQVYEITATGRWSNGGICGWHGPDGAEASPLCRIDIAGYGFPSATLMGRIGDTDRPFQVGKRLRLEVRTSGVLYLKDYDDPSMYGDNAGSVDVTVVRADTATAAPAAPPAAAGPRLPEAPIAVDFPAARPRPDDIAVIVANADYGRLGRDIPDVRPAYGDAAGIHRYVTRALGVREGNIIDLRDATGAQMQRVFGTEANPRGQLHDWVKPGRSRVFVYYAGHGAPGGADGGAYLVPSDADGARIAINGYPLAVLYANLAQLPAVDVTVVLEACFSGASQAGSVIGKASPVYIRPKTPPVPANLTVIAAGAPDQLASWEPDGNHSLFTSHFLRGMAGAADAKPHGNGDGSVSLPELQAYLADTVTYLARRHYGRDQSAVIVTGGGR